MVDTILADASPEKRLFISLITRDISLVDAMLDIIDNSINAALEPLATKLNTADDYHKLLSNSQVKPKVAIELTISASRIAVNDTANGISSEMAKTHVFKFGRDAKDKDKSDRLSVYGLGLKRAMFKCGNSIRISSDHKEGGFSLDLDVKEWAKEKTSPWRFAIEPRPPKKDDCGTRILISELHDDVKRRISDGMFLDQLRDRIARTYSFYIGRVVTIALNGEQIHKDSFEIGGNYASEKFISGKVSCNVTAGIAVSSGDTFRDRNAGWFVFCNGRAVLFADKTSLTGWGGPGLPIFQPKHRPFVGTVFFVSSDPESLPWTTTKASINEESVAWQEARRHMATVGRAVITFLEKRYADDSGGVGAAELQRASGPKVSVLTAAVAKEKIFQAPSKRVPKTTRIQYDAKVDDVQKIETFLRRRMGGSAVGRYTFDYFLKNVAGGNN